MATARTCPKCGGVMSHEQRRDYDVWECECGYVMYEPIESQEEGDR